jgi:hypothetical protein
VARAAGLHAADVIEINSIAILKSAILADMGATILPVAPVQAESSAAPCAPCPSTARRSRARWCCAPPRTSR